MDNNIKIECTKLEEGWQIRLVQEYKELLDKLTKLVYYIDNGQHDDEMALNYLEIQYHAMHTYKSILQKRIVYHGLGEEIVEIGENE